MYIHSFKCHTQLILISTFDRKNQTKMFQLMGLVAPYATIDEGLTEQTTGGLKNDNWWGFTHIDLLVPCEQ